MRGSTVLADSSTGNTVLRVAGLPKCNQRPFEEYYVMGKQPQSERKPSHVCGGTTTGEGGSTQAGEYSQEELRVLREAIGQADRLSTKAYVAYLHLTAFREELRNVGGGCIEQMHVGIRPTIKDWREKWDSLPASLQDWQEGFTTIGNNLRDELRKAGASLSEPTCSSPHAQGDRDTHPTDA
jgi:hypothetical protein